ncbi:MAG: hypothetical protein IKG30_02225 [Clostridiales bacterium]|nr:hypothetical protein [Clostridiales bacterium]
MKNTKLLIISLVAFVFFGIIIFFMRNLIFGGIAGTYEEAQPNKSAYTDKWISYEVIACFGEYAEETETEYFIPTGHSYYYLIWMADGSIMPLSVSKKADKEYLDALTLATYDYCDGKTRMIEMEPRTFIGTIKSQETEALRYYNEALTGMETTAANGWTIRYELMDCTDTRLGYILLCSAVIMIPVFGIVSYIVSVKKEKKTKVNGETGYLPR